MDLRRFLEQAIQITSALSGIHRSGSLHLDIRPANIVVNPETGQAELRAGSAAARGDAAPTEEQKRDPASLPYIAPEQTGRVDRPIDERTDLYALGVTLYELLAGKRPFEAEDASGWVHCHVARAPVPLAEMAPNVPAVVGDILMKLLAKTSEERYQTALGLAVDLRRCLSELKELGRINPFPLGSSDIPDKLQIPAKLYGRKQERVLLLEAFERVVSSGAAELVLVAGYSGIGKTSLVREVQEPIVREHGAFISGKFEQLQRDIPYRTISQAFGELVRQILTESPQALAAWTRRLEDALGQNGRLITEIIPQLSLIIGDQPPVPPLPPSEARNRFLRVFQAFLGAVARKKHPLVLFVDDLQWTDPASLKLIRHIVAMPEARYMLVIGAYRDNEVGPSHPLMEVLEEIRTAGARISTIRLGPLPQEHLIELVMDTFRCDDFSAAPLTRLLGQKTGGNPFFVSQFLTELHREKLLRLDPEKAVWRWDIEEIQAQNLTDNVVDLVLSRVRRLGPETWRVLTLAACVGSRIEAGVLTTLHGKSPEETHADIYPAIREGLVASRGGTYKFLHDRVQQAAYLLIPEVERPQMHLRVGRLLLAEASEEALEERLFEIANQLDIGAPLITEPGERRRVAELNLRAGRKARASGAYGSAVSYFSAGASLLKEDGWKDHSALAFALHLELAESACLNGEFERSEHLGLMLLERATTTLDKVAAYRVRMQVHTLRSEHDRCTDVGLECLSLLGIELHRNPSDEEVLTEVTKLRNALRERADEEILNSPRMTDPVTIATMGAIAAVYPSSSYMDPSLNDLLVCHMVRLSLQHGNADASCIGYASFGKVLCMRLNAYRDGDWLGKLGFDLIEKWNTTIYKPEVANIFGCVISVWTRHIDTYINFSRIGIQAANDVGNATWGTFNQTQLTLGMFVRGDPLDEAYKTSTASLDYATRTNILFAADVVKSIQRFYQAMRGFSDQLATLSGEGFDERAFEEHLDKESFPTVRLIYQVMKTAQRLLAGSYEEATMAARAARENSSGGSGMVISAEYHYYGALARAAYFMTAPAEVQAELRQALEEDRERLRGWSESCPENFSGRYALVSAEIARIEGKYLDAAALYDRAIEAFRKNGFSHQEAIASELAARFYLDRGYTGLPGLYLREAVGAYSRWGASAKVRQLEQRYALVLDQEQRRATSRGVMNMAADAFDAQTAMKVSKALSSDMTPAEMMGSLMRLVVEHEGAERCCLLLVADGLRLAAEGVVGRDGINLQVFDGSAAPIATRIPMSIINYAQRTQERVLISSVAESSAFAGDDYLIRERPKSVLCLPLMKNPGELGGFLYLENRLVHGAFILRRLSLLEFLAALSLQNTVLRGELEQEKVRRERAEEALRRSEKWLQDVADSGDPAA